MLRMQYTALQRLTPAIIVRLIFGTVTVMYSCIRACLGPRGAFPYVPEFSSYPQPLYGSGDLDQCHQLLRQLFVPQVRLTLDLECDRRDRRCQQECTTFPRLQKCQGYPRAFLWPPLKCVDQQCWRVRDRVRRCQQTIRPSCRTGRKGRVLVLAMSTLCWKMCTVLRMTIRRHSCLLIRLGSMS